jgi:hypothetical protein
MSTTTDTTLWTKKEEDQAARSLLVPLIQAGLSEPEQRAVVALRLNLAVKSFADNPGPDDYNWRTVLKLLGAFRAVSKINIEPERGGPGDL